jgi:hypothetical protein
LNLEKLAIWTACSVRWSGLVRHLHDDTQIAPLRNFLNSTSQTIQANYTWSEPAKIPDGIKTDLRKFRDDEKGSEAHWCFLPWEWWLLEPDFLRFVKSLQEFWQPAAEDETDWLKSLLTMTRPISAVSNVATK